MSLNFNLCHKGDFLSGVSAKIKLILFVGGSQWQRYYVTARVTLKEVKTGYVE